MGLMADVVARLRLLGKSSPIPAVDAGNSANSEVGKRPTPENSTKYLYRQMWVDPDVRQAILDVREMDRLDGRVRRIHARIARDAVKGGLVLTQTKDAPGIRREWEAFVDRLQLRNPQKLKSDARGLAMEGNLPLQWVLDDALNVVAGVRMPAETLLPNVGENGRFKSAAEAYHQIDMMTGGKIATFPMWQLFVCRLDPDSFDDMGALGRPFLDASREVWRTLRMTEEDLVIRRRHRAPLRRAHHETVQARGESGVTAKFVREQRSASARDDEETTLARIRTFGHRPSRHGRGLHVKDIRRRLTRFPNQRALVEMVRPIIEAFADGLEQTHNLTDLRLARGRGVFGSHHPLTLSGRGVRGQYLPDESQRGREQARETRRKVAQNFLQRAGGMRDQVVDDRHFHAVAHGFAQLRLRT